jgi:hypothetical protein
MSKAVPDIVDLVIFYISRITKSIAGQKVVTDGVHKNKKR